ncbi:MAG: hypothetical protein PHC43_01635 [Candidatus Marinimicrobia bacterium]|jgi:hypothetical protein|nr:hypothetical protein [Candidatus Neomarinimicrobiota bacterium]MDD5230010.1 hypothetical protein [Candidatus Neomarinimicrobiota bacterium]MDD5540498.1 hypothetical protein [Candidatus Neomarinimicrobiota bacterium]
MAETQNRFTYAEMQALIKHKAATWGDVIVRDKGTPDAYWEANTPETAIKMREGLVKLNIGGEQLPLSGKPEVKPGKPEPPKNQPPKAQVEVKPPAPEKPAPTRTEPGKSQYKPGEEFHSIISLGNNQQMNVTKKIFHLTLDDKQIYDARNGFKITHEAYITMNQFAGVRILKPPTLAFDGKEVSNPVVIRDSKKQYIELVVIRKIAFGRALNGNFFGVDQTVSYIPRSMFQLDLLNLASRFPGIATVKATASLTDEDKTTCFIEELIEGLSVVVMQVNHREFISRINILKENQIWGDRKAETICERNCLRKHPSIGVSSVRLVGTGSSTHAEVPVYRFEEPDRERFEAIAGMIQDGRMEDLKNFEKVDISKHLDQADTVESDTEIPTQIPTEE